ncbi:hypothetical protein [Candidatus Uabimicrobium sp. HlEnr_7]|uniref:hypothetical protein n=1 Tax=Candidatus Uabimicrobium helgolandensis TaxID=3095367 RepID=UPI00355666BB
MAKVDYTKREVTVKIVYCGPDFSGKKTTLKLVYSKHPDCIKSEMYRTIHDDDEILHFEFRPIEWGTLSGMSIKVLMYAMPNSPSESTKNVVLNNIDSIIFIADSGKIQENFQSLRNLDNDLKVRGIDILDVITSIQWNKRDMINVYEISDLQQQVNYLNIPSVPSVACTGEGSFPALKICSLVTLRSLYDQKEVEKQALVLETEQQGRSFTYINDETEYNGCTFYFKKDSLSSLKRCIFSDCSFRGDGGKIELVECCYFSNCGFWGEFVVDLPSQDIKSIPGWIYYTTFISTLSLKNNNILGLSYKIGKLKRLSHLYLDNNQITSLPSTIERLDSLKLLSLSGNNINKEQQNLIRLWLPSCEILF